MDASPSICFQQPQPSPALAHVTAVNDVGDGESAEWNFDTDIAGVTDGSALWIDGNPPFSGISITGSRQATCVYPTGSAPGDAWESQTTLPQGITFVGGAHLAADSGAVS